MMAMTMQNLASMAMAPMMQQAAQANQAAKRLTREEVQVEKKENINLWWWDILW